jgi:hypothetical protein
VCFQGKIVTSPISIICYACSLIGYWAGLFGELDKRRAGGWGEYNVEDRTTVGGQDAGVQETKALG